MTKSALTAKLGNPALRVCWRALWASLTMAAAWLAVPAIALAASLTVITDQALIVKMDAPASTLILGNPAIADISTEDGQLLVVTGKTAGITNLIALDDAGAEILNLVLTVKDPAYHYVTLHKGINRQSYSCTPDCAPVLRTGDSATSFDTYAAQIDTKTNLASSSGSGK